MQRLISLCLLGFALSVTASILPVTPKISGSLDDTCTTAEHLSQVAADLHPLLAKLRKRTFFKIFQVNLHNECPFWAQDRMCALRTCGVCECPDEDIPLPWKMTKTDKVDTKTMTKFRKWGAEKDENILVKNTQWWDDQNQWIAVDAGGKSTYVNLELNPEQYTGYQGYPAQQVWSAIYDENCFQGPLDDLCYEERVLYRVISGLHAAIAMHVSENYFRGPNVTTSYNMAHYREKVGAHPDRIKNMHFVLSLLLRAVNRASSQLRSFDYDTGNPVDDIGVRTLIDELFEKTQSECPRPFNESVMFQGHITREMMQQRFRNISLIIDCVSCETCRLHAKLQTLGLGTAFKVLFANDNVHLERNEVIALVVTLSKFVNAVRLVEVFRGRELQRVATIAGVGVAVLVMLCVAWKLAFRAKSKSKNE